MRGSQPWRTNRSRALRSQSSSAEDLIWTELRARRLAGLKFVRQCPIGPYFVDFACREQKIIVEIDGGTHSTEDELRRDAARTFYLEAQGFDVFRVTNQDIYDNLVGVLNSLLGFIDSKAP